MSTKKKVRGLKRKSMKYPGLEKNLYSKIKQTAIDQDYFHLLNDKEKEWMNKFMTEYAGANFTDNKKALHKSKKSRKSVFDANNARQRDVLNQAKMTGDLYFEEDVPSGASTQPWFDEENLMIKQLKQIDIERQKRNKPLFQNCTSYEEMCTIADTDEERNILSMIKDYITWGDLFA